MRSEKAYFPFTIKRLFLQYGDSIRLPRGAMLLTPGMEAGHAWLLRQGIVKHYHYSRQGDLEVCHFYLRGDLMVLEEEFLEEKKANSYLEVVTEDAVLTVITHAYFQKFLHQYPQIWPTPLMRLLLLAQKRFILRSQLSHGPAEDRYKLFLNYFPAQLLMAKDIAAYLRLDPSTISRIRNKQKLGFILFIFCSTSIHLLFCANCYILDFK